MSKNIVSRALVAGVLAASVAALFAAPANAGNISLYSPTLGDIIFPFTPPKPNTNTPGLIDNMTIGATTPRAGRFTQVQPAGGVPTIGSGDCGASTNGAVVAGSTNQAGAITIGATATTTCKVTFAAGLSSAFKACVFFPRNAAAAATGTTVAFAGAPTLTDVTLTGTALANANYSYVCM